MVHLIIFNWFNWSGVWIWNWFRIKFNWKLWRVNLNITIIIGMTINPPIISETTGLVLGGEVMNPKWADGGWMLQFICGSFGSSPWRTLNLFIFIPRICGRMFLPWIMKASALYKILPQHSQILFCLMRRFTITVWRDAVSLLMEDEGKKWWERWIEVVNVVGDQIISRYG